MKITELTGITALTGDVGNGCPTEIQALIIKAANALHYAESGQWEAVAYWMANDNNIDAVTQQRDQLADELAALMESSKGALAEIRAERDQLLAACKLAAATFATANTPQAAECLDELDRAITHAERGAK